MVTRPFATIDALMKKFREICHDTAGEHFSRFPAILLELEKIANFLLEKVIKPRLKHAFDFVSQRARTNVNTT
jgi:hypothetical protein